MMPPLALALLIGCGPDKADAGSDTDSGADAPSPWEMPDYGGCTRTFTRDDELDGVTDLETSSAYDGEQRLVSYLASSREVYEAETTYTYDDAGCLTAYHGLTDYDDDTFGADYASASLDYTQTCDAQGNPLARSGTSQGEPFTVAYENTYDGDQLVETVATLSWTSTGAGSVTGWSWTWDGDLLVSEATALDSTPISLETWTFDARGNVVGDRYDDLVDPEESWEQAFTYDEHDRLVGASRASDAEGLLWTYENDWYEEIYQVAERRFRAGEASEDGTVYAWDCTGAWPWSCDWTGDGDLLADVLPDGTPDLGGAEGWTCP